MNTNGNPHVDDAAAEMRIRRLLVGAASAEAVMGPLDRAADALREVGRTFETISTALARIGSDTARAISETGHLKKYLKLFGEREAKTRAELDALKTQMALQKELLAGIRALEVAQVSHQVSHQVGHGRTRKTGKGTRRKSRRRAR